MNRTISDDRITAVIELPHSRVVVNGAKVRPVFDWVTGYTGEVFCHAQQKMILSSQGPHKTCVVQPAHVKTFDGVKFTKEPSTCPTIVSKILSPQDHILVLAKSQTPSESSEQEIRILSTHKGVDVKVLGSQVKVTINFNTCFDVKMY